MSKQKNIEPMFDLEAIPVEKEKTNQHFSPAKGIDNLVGALCDPIIVFQCGWATKDFIPEWLRNRITLDRMIELMVATNEKRDPIGTDSEALAYMMPRTMEAPLDHDWHRIYLYLATKVLDGEKDKVVPDDIRVDKLEGNQERDLLHLKHWIYNTKLKHRKERLKDIRKEKKQRRAEAEGKAEQPELFEF